MSIERPRTIITADPELDDLNSMIRLLLYSNEIEIAGLVYASSRFHWRGDGKGTEFFLPDREYDAPRTSFRWAPGERFIDDALDAYGQVHENLVAHDPRYPTESALRALVREGNVDFEGDMSAESPGSQLIADVLLDERTDPVHLQMWAGPSTVARALRSIEERFGAEPSWPDVQARVSAKAVITKFASQDETYDDYIRPVWPEIRVTDVAAMAWGYFTRKTARAQDLPLLSAQWMRENVTSVGPLGALYRVWGDGRQMVPGDLTDFFHLSGLTAAQLRAQGYRVWTDPEAAGEWISEGDTTNMLNLIVPALRGHEHPSYGGWGGRAERTDIGTDTWAIADAVDESAGGGPESSITRWFATAQRDFAARLQWSVHAARDEVNHHPVLRVTIGTDPVVAPGARVPLAAEANDPDGDAVTVQWWVYPEAGTCAPGVSLSAEVGTSTELIVPHGAREGETIHIVVEATDDASPALTSYARVIATVGRAV